jgi:flagellar motor switch protein FliN/FliY
MTTKIKTNASALEDVSVEISVVLGRAVMPIRSLLKMGRGAVIDLDSNVDSMVKIYANDRLIGKGDVVISGDRVAVTVTESMRDYQS